MIVPRTVPSGGPAVNVAQRRAAVTLHFMYYNSARPHHSLERNMTPAMAGGLSDHVWTCQEIAALLD
jgi:hypothetical protein